MKTDSLSQLIHSLSQSEKRQFVLENSVSRGSSTYMKLYAWYARQTVPQSPDEKTIRSLKLTPASLAVLKNYLSTKILDLLVRNAGSKSTTLYVQNLLAQAEVLFTRGLHSQARKITRRALQVAETNELFPLQLAIYALEETHAGSHSEVEEVHKSFARKKELLKIIGNEYDCLEFSQRIVALGTDLNYARLPEERQKLARFANDPMMMSDHLPLSTSAFHHLMHGRLHYYTMALDVNGMLKMSRDHFSYFENKPAAAHKDPDFFLGMTYSILNNVMQLGSQAEVTDILSRWAKLPVQYKTCFGERHLAQYRVFTHELQIRLMLIEGRSVQILPALLRKTKQLKNDLQYYPAFETNMRFFIALGKYLAGDYKGSLRILIDELSETSSGNRRYRFVLRAMLLQLVIHCEQKHEDTVEELTRNLQRFIDRENCRLFPENLFPEFFMNWVETPDTKRQALFRKTIEKITAAFAEQKDWQFGINNRFFMAWLIQHARQIGFDEALLVWNTEFRKRLETHKNT
ncbi:MAG: hypothetical protein MUC87_17875 [Bacteroidia bacterium]|jgi:hypothetical protein|nr:hypothetical protein [Bacteroidia bacterium]